MSSPMHNHSSPSRGSGVGGRPTMVALSVVTAVSVVYAGCSIEPQVHIIIYLPSAIPLSKGAFSVKKIRIFLTCAINE